MEERPINRPIMPLPLFLPDLCFLSPPPPEPPCVNPALLPLHLVFTALLLPSSSRISADKRTDIFPCVCVCGSQILREHSGVAVGPAETPPLMLPVVLTTNITSSKKNTLNACVHTSFKFYLCACVRIYLVIVGHPVQGLDQVRRPL